MTLIKLTKGESMKSIEEIREEFSKDLYATEVSGIEIEEAMPNYAKCSMKLTGRHKNAYGGIMGGAIYTLADFTFAVASNNNTDRLTASLVGQATFLSMTRGTVLFGEARLIKDGRLNCFYEVRIYDDLGKDIAVVSFTGAHVEKFVSGN